MAEILPAAADIEKTDGGAYKWAGFVTATPTGNNTLDSMIIPNELDGQRRPTYMRIQLPIEYTDAPQAHDAGLAAWAEYELDGGGDPIWHMEDEATQGTNSLRFSIIETANPGTAHVFFVEYGIEHSVGK